MTRKRVLHQFRHVSRTTRSLAFSILIHFAPLLAEMAWVCRVPLFASLVFCLTVGFTDQGAEYLVLTAERVRQISDNDLNFKFFYLPTVIAFYGFIFLLVIYSLLPLLTHARESYNGVLSRNRYLLAVGPLLACLPPIFTMALVGTKAQTAILSGSPAGSFEIPKYRKLADNLAETIATHFWFALIVVSAGLFMWFLLQINAVRRALRQPTRDLLGNLEVFLRSLVYFLLPVVAATVWAGEVFFRPLGDHSSYGAFHVLILMCTGMLITLGALHFHLARFGVPVTTVLFAAFIATNVFRINRPPPAIDIGDMPKEKYSVEDDAESQQRSRALRLWLDERVKETKTAGERVVPIYLVAAQGGGIYAAYHAAKALARLSRFDPYFQNRLLAISGASGGSLGAAVYHEMAVRRKLSVTTNGHEQLCSEIQIYWSGVESQIDKLFGADFISPMIAHAFRIDIFREIGLIWVLDHLLDRASLHPVPSRDIALGATLARELSNIFGAGTPAGNPIGESWSATNATPALFLNVTSAATGNRLYLSPWSLEAQSNKAPRSAKAERRWFRALTAPYTTSVDAALMSARFPYITPATHLRIGGESHRFLDGGYFDNSGLVTLQDIKTILRDVLTAESDKNPELNFELVILATTLESSDGVYVSKPAFYEWATPLTLLNQIRAARGEEVVSDAESIQQEEELKSSRETLRMKPTVRERFIKLPLRTANNFLPLGWAVSEQTRKSVSDSVDLAMGSIVLPEGVPTCSGH